MASSLLYPGEVIHDDSTPDLIDEPGQGARGYMAMFRGPMDAAAVTSPFPDTMLIPRADWQGMIEEMEERKTRPSDLINQAGLPCKNQEQTSLCWGNSPVHLLEGRRILQGQSKKILSPASVTCPINGFRNRGGYGGDAVERLLSHGANTVEVWPANAIDKRYYTEAAKKEAFENYRALEWYLLKPRNLDQHISCLLRRLMATVGLNYWAHQVTDYEPVWHNGQIGVRYRNSWGMNWPNPGAMGYSIRQGNKLLADDILTLVSVTAS